MTNKIPEWGAGGVVHMPKDTTQVGCVYCLGQNLEAPVEFGVVYFWQGTSFCRNHLKSVTGAS